MGKLRSNRVKRVPQTGITSDRYNFLGLNQAEPNLGDPRVGPSSVGVNPIKAGAFYQLAAIAEYPGERYWSTNVGIGSTLGVVSVYANDVLPNSAFERIHGLNFVGTGVTIETPPLELFDGIGIATIRFTVTDFLNQGPPGQVIYNGLDGRVKSASQLYYSSNNVGIGSTQPQFKLDVLGNSRFKGTINAGGSNGTYGQYLSATGTGITWSSFPILRTGLTTVATAGQVGFNTTYNVGFLDVFVNGIRLNDADFVADDGNIITLNNPCFGGEVVDILAYSVLSFGAGSGNIGSGGSIYITEGNSQWVTVTSGIYTGSNVGVGTEDPQYNLHVVGDAKITGIMTVGNASITLDGNTNNVYVGSGVTIYGDTGDLFLNGVPVSPIGESGSVNTSGIITASYFYGDGSGLTNLPGGGGGATSFADLSDVNVSTAQTGVALIYDGTQWINGPTIGGIPGVPTPFSINSTLLILGGGTLGDNTFTDSSITGAGVTAVGSGVTYSDNPIHFGETTISFDGASYLDVQVSTGVTFAAYEDFTLEFWSYQTDNSSYQSVMMWTDGDYEGLYIYDGYLEWYEWSGFTSSQYLTTDEWHYIVVQRKGNKLSYYIDGNLDNEGNGFGGYSYSGTAAIGVNGTRSDEYFLGNLGGINFIKGTALYSGPTIPVPTVGFTSTITGTNNVGGVPYSIRNLDDVSDTEPLNGQILVWNNGAQEYTPGVYDTYTNNISIGSTGSGGYNNTFLGKGAGQYTTSGCHNNFFGNYAGLCNLTGIHNNFFGYCAGRSNQCGEFNNFFGYYAGKFSACGFYNNFIGQQAGQYNVSGSSNNFIGHATGIANISGCYNNFFGAVNGWSNTTGCYNNFFGLNAGYSNTSGNHNNFMGSMSGFNNTTGSCNILIGRLSGYCTTTQSNKIIIGNGYASFGYWTGWTYYGLDTPAPSKDNQLAIGLRTNGYSTDYWIVGDENFNIGIGTTNPTSKLTVTGDAIISGIVTATSFDGKFKDKVFVSNTGAVNLTVSNGTIQIWTLTDSRSPSDSMNEGESLTLMIDDGTGYTITWPSVTWVNGVPTLSATGYTVIELWKANSVLYGVKVGNT